VPDVQTRSASLTVDRIADPWGPRTPYGRGDAWPTRVDQYLADGVDDDDVEQCVQSPAKSAAPQALVVA
jgi:hypothetical protein